MGAAPRIIDVDAHAEPAPGWLEDFPDLAARLPELLPDTDPRFALGTAEMFAWFVSDDLLHGVPREERMPIDRLVNPAIEFLFTDDAQGLTFPGADQYAPLLDPEARVAWLDAQGIATQNLISGGGYTLARAVEDPGLSRDALQAVNTWMTDAVGQHRDRLLPVACLRFDDIDWAVTELRRVRERGSRAFLVSSKPAGGIPPSSPDFDPVWAAATEQGMVPLLHIGMSPAMLHPGWANVETRVDPAPLRAPAVAERGDLPDRDRDRGVFEGHPDLTILISELGIDWLPDSPRSSTAWPRVARARWSWGSTACLSPRGVHPPERAHLAPPGAAPVAGRAPHPVPGVAVFSSDFPHFEGNGEPLPYYRDLLADVDDDVLDGFLGGSIADAYERMGDPL